MAETVGIHRHFDPEAERHFRVLAHLDLGRDAANLFRPERVAPWAAALTSAYRAAPGRLSLQFLPLWGGGVERLLREDRVPALRDAPGRTLAARWLEAMAEQPTDRLEPPPLVASDRLQRLRHALYADPPPLLLLHCPSIGVHARALTRRDGVRVVATDLGQPEAWVQIFHEECHPISDPTVDHRGRDTRAGTAGHAVHMALERAAVELGQRVVDEHVPEAAAAYARWRARFGGPVTLDESGTSAYSS